MKQATSAKIKERELIIKITNEGKTCREIASLLGISKSKVSYWMLRYRETDDLRDKPRSGRPTLLTREKLSDIAEKITAGLHGQKYRAGISSKEVLLVLKEETGRTYTLRHVQRVLHAMGLSLITPRVSHIKRDREAQNKFREEFKKSSSRTTKDALL